MLKTALEVMPRTISSIRPYPPFIDYSNIEQIDVEKSCIDLSKDYPREKRKEIMKFITDSFQKEESLHDDLNSMTKKEVKQINKLLTSWRNNKKLRLFLEVVETSIFLYPTKKFDIHVQYIPQQFGIESFDGHYNLQLKPMENDIDRRLLLQANEKFHQMYTGHFKRLVRLVPTSNTAKEDSFFN